MFEKGQRRKSIIGGGGNRYPPLEVSTVQRGCTAFLDAHAAVVELGEDEGRRGNDARWADPALVAAARHRRSEALSALRRMRASSAPDIQAKMQAVFILEDWVGCEDKVVAEFAVEVLREAAWFLKSDRNVGASPTCNGANTPQGRGPWLGRFQRLLVHNHDN